MAPRTPRQTVYLNALDQLVKYQNELMAESGRRVSAAVASTLQLIPTQIALLALAVTVLAIWVIRSTTGPLKRAVEIAGAVAGG